MHKLTLERVVLGFWILGGGWIAACSLGTSGTATTTNDASVDGGKDTGALDEPAIDGPTDVTVPVADVVTPVEATTDAPIEASATDTGTDAPTCTAANCGGACCGNVCVPRTCVGCQIGTLFCPYSSTVPNSNGQCLGSCSNCTVDGTSLNAACFSCASGSPIGTCAASATSCPADTDSGACSCSSNGNASDAGGCPGSTQVCRGHACVSCGQNGTQGQQCGTGQNCNQTNAVCGM